MIGRASHPLATLGHADLQRFLEALGPVAFAVDVLPDGCFRFAAANAAFKDAVGHRLGVSGKLAADLFPGRAGFDLDTCFQRCVDTSRRIDWEAELPVADGDRWWHLTVSPLADRTGHVVRVIGTALDLTRRRREEDSLRVSATHMREAVDAMAEGFALWDADDRLIYCNPRFKACYPTVAEILTPGVAFRQVIRNAVANGQFRLDETAGCRVETNPRGQRGNGCSREEWLSDGRWLLATDRLTPTGGLVSFRADITDRKRIERVVRQSRATFQAMMDAVDELIAMVNADRILLAVNRAGARWLGSEPHRLVGRTLDAVFDAETAAAIATVIDEVLNTATRRQTELRIGAKCLEVSLHPVMGEDDMPVAVSFVCRDITGRKAAEASLRKLARAVEHSPAMVAITDATLAIDYVNPKFSDVTGYSADDIAGASARELMFGDLGDIEVADIWSEAAAGRPWSGQVQNRRKDGRTYLANTAVSAIRGSDGGIVNVLILQEDITARVAAEQQAREHQQLLARCQRIATIGETAAALAHEVNQPLTAVVSYCEGAITQLTSGAINAVEVIEALTDACREAERASAIVRGVNSFVRRSPDQRKAFDVNLLVESVVELARKDLERHGVDLRLELGESLPQVMVNGVEVEQVLYNLVRNSIDALAENGTAARRITVRSALVDGRSVEVSVDDSGRGFTAEARKNVFTPFFTTKPGGIGMGLAICRTIIESHGGRIVAADCIDGDGGASVRFSLPLAEEVRLAS